MSNSSAPEYEPDPRPHGGARRVSVFGRNGWDERLERDADGAQWQDSQPTQAFGTAYGDEPQAGADPVFGTSFADDAPAATRTMPLAVGGATPDAAPQYAYGGHRMDVAPAEPVPAAPVRLPRPPRRRRTAATPLGTIVVLLASALLGGGIYLLLTSVDVLAIVQGNGSTLSTPALAAFAAGGVLAFVGFIIACVAVARARPKTAAFLLLLASFILPTAAVIGGAYYGATALKDATVAQAESYATSIDVDRVDALIGEVESLGVDVPGKEQVLEILRAVRGEG
ncbi:hypothetical protein [Actinomyces procaprae]|uniref:hypothetical protein n=1 Tax=Actinomyces procaprae TaxID=2560010 RepID=UPI00109D9C93|nr:hypothetical protein [Actinomyces procaprae]